MKLNRTTVGTTISRPRSRSEKKHQSRAKPHNRQTKILRCTQCHKSPPTRAAKRLRAQKAIQVLHPNPILSANKIMRRKAGGSPEGERLWSIFAYFLAKQKVCAPAA